MSKTVANNRRARFEYFIEETFEAGIVLVGTEVKSIRQGKVSLNEAFCLIENGEVFIHNMHISPYDHGNIQNLDPARKRKLLLHRREIDRLFGAVQADGMALIPLSVNIRRSLVKVDIALARGKKLYDKREAQKERDHQREMDRAISDFNR